MSFLALLVAVLLHKLSGTGQILQRDGWFETWQGVLRGFGLSGVPFALLAVALQRGLVHQPGH